MKYKPEVKNELILESALFVEINGSEVSYPLRAVVLWEDILELKPHEEDDRVRGLGIQLLLSSSQVESLIRLWQEWKDDE